MKQFYQYLKILVYFLIFATVVQILVLAGDIVTPLQSFWGLPINDEPLSFTQAIPTALKIALLCYLIFILTGVLRMAGNATKKGLFSKKNIIGFKKYGKAIVYYTVFALAVSLINNYVSPEFRELQVDSSIANYLGHSLGYALGNTLTTQAPLVILALFFFMLAELAKNGYELKKENDLTI